MTTKTFRKTIRINGVEHKSPRFLTKKDADAWYAEKHKEKLFAKEGMHMPLDKVTTLNEYFDNIWFPKRVADYPPSTYTSDKQRYDDYVRNKLGKMKVAKINQLQVRTAIRDVREKYGRSIQTRNRVRALLSKIFNDALNEERPLRADNPALNVSFDDPRVGKKKPVHIKQEKKTIEFLRAAKELGRNHFVQTAIALMAGPRKSEIIPLTYGDVDRQNSGIEFSRRYMQAASAIVDGLKSGSDDSRFVHVPDALLKIIEHHRKHATYQADEDFILAREDGRCFSPREISYMHDEVCAHSGIKVTFHGLRHTFGRQFALNTGNVKALQAILGHASSQTTQLYSELAGLSVSKFRNSVTFDLGDDDDE